MIRVVRFVRRRQGTTADDFRWRLLTTAGGWWQQTAQHLPVQEVTLSFPRVEQVENFRTDRGVPPAPVDFDAVEEASFATLADLQQLVASGFLSAFDGAISDIVDVNAEETREVSHAVVVASRSDAELNRPVRLKTVLTVARKQGLDRYAFRDYWLNHHALIEQEAVEFGTLHHIEVGFALGRQLVRSADGHYELQNGASAYDAFMDMYSSSGTDLVAGYERPLPPEVLADEARFLNPTVAGRRAIMDEYRLVP